MSRNIRWAAFLIAMILSLAAAKGASAIIVCVENPEMGYSCDPQGYNCVCFDSGGGCSSCFHGGGGGGSSECTYDWITGDEDCVYQN